MASTGGPRVGVVGTANVDLVVRTASLPRPGETVVGGDVERLPGGKGANQAAAAAVLGAHATLFASVGHDPQGQWLLDGLAERGVDVSRVRRSGRPTGSAFITVASDGENQIVVAPGANADLELAGEDLAGYDVVLTQLEVGPRHVAWVAANSRRCILNAAPATSLDARIAERCAVVIVNEVEAASLDVAGLDHVVVTMGARGAVRLANGREVARAAAPRVGAVDTVGAGDVFCAAYAVLFAEGAAPEETLAFAVAAGALATLAPGAQGSLPTREEVRECRG